MGKKYIELMKNLGLFFIASFLPNALAFFMIPLYTSCLTKAEYGVVDLLTNTVQLLMPILTIQIQDAVMRYALDKAWDKGDVFSVGVRIVLGGFLLLGAGCIAIKALGLFPLEGIYLVFLLINYLAGSLNNIFSFFCRGIDQVKVLTVGSVLNMVIVVGCNLLFLLKFHWGLYGYLAANSIGLVLSIIYIVLGAKLYRYLKWKSVNRALAEEMVKFSFPLIFSALSWWVNNASDKYILTFFCGVSAVGLYAVAYKIPTILKVFGDVIAMAFSISAIKEFDVEDRDGFIGKSYSMISFFMTASCSAIILCNLLIAKILFAGEFYQAWRYVPPLLVSVLMNQLSFSCENIFVAAKQTKAISKTAVAGAAINTAANFLLIPYFGPYGAAVATALGFTCFWWLRYVILRKSIRMKNHLWKECASYGLLLAQCVFAYWGNRFWYAQLFLLLLILALYGGELGGMARKLHRLKSVNTHNRW